MSGGRIDRFRWLYATLLVLLSVAEFLAVPPIDADHAFLPGKDESWHATNAHLFYDVLVAHPDQHGVDELFRMSVNYPPLCYLSSTAALALAGGGGYDVIRWGMLPFLLLLNGSLWLAGRRLFESDAAGIWAAALLPLSNVFANHLAVYNLQVPLAAWLPATIVALAQSRRLNRTGPVLAFFALAALAFLTYMYAVFAFWLPAAVLFGASLATSRERGKQAGRLVAGAVLFCLLVTPYLMWPDIREWFLRTAPRLTQPAFTERATQWDQMGGRLYYFLQIPTTLGWIVGLTSLVGLVRLRWRRAEELAWFLAAAGMFLCLLAIATAYDERLIPVIVLAALLGGSGIVRTAPFLARPSVLAVLVAFVVLVRLPAVVERSERWSLPDFRPVMTLLERECEASDRPVRPFVFSSTLGQNLELIRDATGSYPCLANDAARNYHDLNQREFTHFVTIGFPHEGDEHNDGTDELVRPVREEFESARKTLLFEIDAPSMFVDPLSVRVWKVARPPLPTPPVRTEE